MRAVMRNRKFNNNQQRRIVEAYMDRTRSFPWVVYGVDRTLRKVNQEIHCVPLHPLTMIVWMSIHEEP